jgi:hypothetical protein
VYEQGESLGLNNLIQAKPQDSVGEDVCICGRVPIEWGRIINLTCKADHSDEPAAPEPKGEAWLEVDLEERSNGSQVPHYRWLKDCPPGKSMFYLHPPHNQPREREAMRVPLDEEEKRRLSVIRNREIPTPPSGEMERDVGVQISGFVHRGPDFDQGFRGWKVYATKQPGIDVPVILTYAPERVILAAEEEGEG